MTSDKLSNPAYEIVPPWQDGVGMIAQAISQIRLNNWRQSYVEDERVSADPAWLTEEIAAMDAFSQSERVRASLCAGSDIYFRLACLGNDAADAVERSTIVGYVEGWQNQPGWMQEDVIYSTELHSLHIREGFRGLGIGSVLIQTLLTEWVQQRDCFVQVAERSPAVELYKRFGFTEKVHGFWWGQLGKGVQMAVFKRAGELALRSKSAQ